MVTRIREYLTLLSGHRIDCFLRKNKPLPEDSLKRAPSKSAKEGFVGKIRFYGCGPGRRLVSVLLLLLLVGACKDQSKNRDAQTKLSPKPFRTLVLGALREPDVLDPLFTGVSAAREPLAAIYRDLVRYDQDWVLRPDVAAA